MDDLSVYPFFVIESFASNADCEEIMTTAPQDIAATHGPAWDNIEEFMV